MNITIELTPEESGTIIEALEETADSCQALGESLAVNSWGPDADEHQDDDASQWAYDAAELRRLATHIRSEQMAVAAVDAINDQAF